MFRKARRLHFVGIGGSGMSGIAEVLVNERGTVLGARILDDDAHHPTEIAATLGAIRDGFDARTLVVFQPTGASVADALQRHGHSSVTHVPQQEHIADLLRRWIRPGDVVVTLGAGDVWKIGDALARRPSERRRVANSLQEGRSMA